MAGQQIWIQSDVVTLIAWLEFCIQNDRGFEKTIVDVLRNSRKERSGQDYSFTLRQVMDKLIQLSRKETGKHAKDYRRPTQILLRGSACFPRLVGELRSQINMAVERFRKSDALSQLQRVRPQDEVPRAATAPDARLDEAGLQEVSTIETDADTVSHLQNKPYIDLRKY